MNRLIWTTQDRHFAITTHNKKQQKACTFGICLVQLDYRTQDDGGYR